MKNKLIFQIILFLIPLWTINAQQPNEHVYIAGSRFTYPILEKWITEYKKVNPLAQITLQYQKQKSDSINLKIIAHTPDKKFLNSGDTYIKINRYALLAIANEQNQVLKRVYKKGFTKNDFKTHFFIDTSFIFERESPKISLINVYAPIEQSSTSIAFASYFGYKPSEIKGKKVSGDEKYLITAIKRDSAGITFNNPGYIYNLQDRLLLPGIKIIPVDINNNGKLDDEEKAFSNLDQLTQFLESNIDTHIIPIDNIGFIVNKNNKNEELSGFINWVLTEGQKYNHQYGFLNRSETNDDIAQIRP